MLLTLTLRPGGGCSREVTADREQPHRGPDGSAVLGSGLCERPRRAASERSLVESWGIAWRNALSCRKGHFDSF